MSYLAPHRPLQATDDYLNLKPVEKLRVFDSVYLIKRADTRNREMMFSIVDVVNGLFDVFTLDEMNMALRSRLSSEQVKEAYMHMSVGHELQFVPEEGRIFMEKREPVKMVDAITPWLQMSTIQGLLDGKMPDLENAKLVQVSGLSPMRMPK